MSEKKVKSIAEPNVDASVTNSLTFVIESMIGKINTATAVRVETVHSQGPNAAAGTISAMPLIGQRDADGEMIDPVLIPRLYYFRLQGGTGAVVCDPVPGDIGFAVFAKEDISNISNEAKSVPPASFRRFSQADGLYVGGLINRAPQTYLHVDQASNTVTVVAPANVNIQAGGAVNVTAGSSVTVKAPQITLDAPQVTLTGRLSQTGENGSGASFTGGMTNTGGTVSSNGVVLDSHRHSGVETGGGTTGGPV